MRRCFRTCMRRHRMATPFRFHLSRRPRGRSHSPPRRRQVPSQAPVHTLPSRPVLVLHMATKLLRKMSVGTRPHLQFITPGAAHLAATLVALADVLWTRSLVHRVLRSMCLATRVQAAQVTFSAFAARSSKRNRTVKSDVERLLRSMVLPTQHCFSGKTGMPRGDVLGNET